MNGADVVQLAVIVANVIVSLVGLRAFGGDDPASADEFVFVPHQVAEGRNGRGLLLSHFAHGDVGHLALNMWGLYSFAQPVIGVLGSAWFLAIYGIAAAGADLAVFALRKDDPAYRCLGASGSVFGIMTAAVVLDPHITIVMFFVPAPIPGPLFMLGYAVVSMFLISRTRRSGVCHEAHLGGALFGLAVTGLLAPRGLQPLLGWVTQWM